MRDPASRTWHVAPQLLGPGPLFFAIYWINVGNYILYIDCMCIYIYNYIYIYNPRWFELLGSTAPIPANFLAEKVGTKTESHGLET